MNINNLTLGQIKEIKALLSLEPICSKNSSSPFIGEIVLVRTYSAGVHVGTLEKKDGTNVLLSNSYRIWRWEGAFTLSEICKVGISGGRVSCSVEFVELTQAIEIIPMSEIAISSVLKHVE